MEYHNITRAQFDFLNRDGVPTALVVKPPESSDASIVSVEVSDDGLSATVAYQAMIDNNGKEWLFISIEDRDGVPVVAPAPAKPELGRTGKAILTVVSLAILAPFVGILWAWAGQVFRSFG